jgi:hypothetical protein
MIVSARKARRLDKDETIYERRVSRPIRSVVSTI